MYGAVCSESFLSWLSAPKFGGETPSGGARELGRLKPPAPAKDNRRSLRQLMGSHPPAVGGTHIRVTIKNADAGAGREHAIAGKQPDPLLARGSLSLPISLSLSLRVSLLALSLRALLLASVTILHVGLTHSTEAAVTENSALARSPRSSLRMSYTARRIQPDSSDDARTKHRLTPPLCSTSR